MSLIQNQQDLARWVREKEDHLDIAVAFWGAGAVEQLGLDGSKKRFRILLDLTSGGSNPKVVQQLLDLRPTPWLLLVALLTSLWLAVHGSRFYLLMLVLQLAGYAAAAMGRLFPELASRVLPVRLATAFLSLNTSAMWALIDYLKNPNAHLWQTTRLENLRR